MNLALVGPRQLLSLHGTRQPVGPQGGTAFRGAAGARPRLPASDQRVLDHLRRTTSGANGPGETLVRLRASQAACFRTGLLVNVVPSLRRLPSCIPEVGLTAETASRLRRLVSPELCAAGAITRAHPHLDLTQLAVRCIRRAGGLIAEGTPGLQMPEYGRGLVHAQRLARVQGGAPLDAPLFVGAAGNRLRPVALRRRLERASALAGLTDPGECVQEFWGPPSLGEWLRVTDVLPFGEDLDHADQGARTG